MEYTLTYWKPGDGSYARVYVNGKWIHDLKMYFDCWNERDVQLHYNHNFDDFPNEFQMEVDPAQALAEAALRENDIDADNYTWEELVEACQ